MGNCLWLGFLIRPQPLSSVVEPVKVSGSEGNRAGVQVPCGGSGPQEGSLRTREEGRPKGGWVCTPCSPGCLLRPVHLGSGPASDSVREVGMWGGPP